MKMFQQLSSMKRWIMTAGAVVCLAVMLVVGARMALACGGPPASCYTACRNGATKQLTCLECCWYGVCGLGNPSILCNETCKNLPD